MVIREPFGRTEDGQAVEKFTIRSSGGMECEVITYGAAVRALRVPAKDGGVIDTVLGYDTLSGYERNGGFMGAVVGRYANRIAGAGCLIDGERVALEPSEGKNQLHGGKKGFDSRVFEGEAVGGDTVILRYDAADGEGGFPGGMAVTVIYALDGSTLRVRYQAKSDKPTYCNLTNHSYFNLNGGGSVLNHTLLIPAEAFTPVDGESIPIKQGCPVEGTPFDFREAKPLGRDINADDRQLKNTNGYDHNFIISLEQSLEPRPLALAARLEGETLAMEVWSQKPAIQLYSGNGLSTDGSAKGGTPYRPHEAVCLETQFIPDSPNHPEWGDILLRPGGLYDFSTEYRFFAK